MPLPIILGTAAALAGTTGLGAAIYGAAKMAEANDTMDSAKWRHEENIHRFEMANAEANATMDELGKLELGILNNFDAFSNLIEKIQNRPEFKAYSKDGVKLPQYNREKLKEVASCWAGLAGPQSAQRADLPPLAQRPPLSWLWVRRPRERR